MHLKIDKIEVKNIKIKSRKNYHTSRLKKLERKELDTLKFTVWSAIKMLNVAESTQ
jgi:hypothetical protein